MMLSLTMLRCPDSVPPQSRTVEGGEFSIGRGPENDWVLADPERYLSKRHCVLAFHSGAWKIADCSTNGTFLNRDGEPLGRGQIRDLRDGDRLHLGGYEIEIRLQETAAAGSRQAAADPFDIDPFAARAPAQPGGRMPLLDDGPGSDPVSGVFASSAINLPADYDPLAPDPAEDQDLLGPAQSDHAPHLNDAFMGAVARSVIPEDWDRDIAPQSAPPRSAPPVETRAPAPAPAPVPAPETMPPQRAATPPPRAIPAAGDDLLASFLRGAGIEDLQPANPAATMEALGATFREVVFGLRQLMIARAAIKTEFRIEQTGIRSRGNNPLKFSANDDDALAALMGTGRRTEMAAVDAVAEALNDIRVHELASMAAMQSAVRALLKELDPEKLRRLAGEGGINIVPAQRKARAWDAFEAHYTRLSQALADDFDSVFGKAFARAYELALSEAAAREPRR
jgi:type VI secretion system FHA domain protein